MNKMYKKKVTGGPDLMLWSAWINVVTLKTHLQSLSSGARSKSDRAPLTTPIRAVCPPSPATLQPQTLKSKPAGFAFVFFLTTPSPKLWHFSSSEPGASLLILWSWCISSSPGWAFLKFRLAAFSHMFAPLLLQLSVVRRKLVAEDCGARFLDSRWWCWWWRSGLLC